MYVIKDDGGNMKHKKWIFVLLTTLLLVFSGCGALNTAVKKRNLDVQTKMSETIWLSPVSANQKTVFVQIKNTSGKVVNVEEAIKRTLSQKGYYIVQDPNQASYWLQANVLKLDKVDLRESDPFGSGILGAGVGATLGAYNTGSMNTAIGLGLAGALIAGTVDALVSDVAYTMITDIMISEKTNSKVTVTTNNNLTQGTRGRTKLTTASESTRNQYQTRVVSVANQVNLKFEEAQPTLEAQLQQVIAGIF